MLKIYTVLTIIIISIVFIFLFEKVVVESFEEKPKIFMYWEYKKGVTKRPAYLDLCLKTIKKHCSNSFDIVVLNEKTINNYLPNVRTDLDEKLSIPQKTDYYRYALLYKYGGIWLDFDTIVMQDLKPLYDNLEKYDYIGSGCHSDDCKKTGYPFPSNGVMMSRAGTKFINTCLEDCDKILNENTDLKKKYFILGRTTMWKNIDKLMKKGWDYFHIDSKCQERDSKDVKLRNKRFLSDENIDEKCIGKMFFVPVYNTAPGFPDWFKEMSLEKILESNLLIGKLFRLSLQNE